MTLFTLLSLISLSFAGPEHISYQGRLFDESGEPINSGSTEFVVQVLDPSGQCTLFEETHNLSMLGKEGFFVISVGTGTQNTASAPAFTIVQSLSNAATLSDGKMNCTGNSFTPNTTDSRILKVYVDGTALEPAQTIGSVAYAFHANDANTLQGLGPTDFIQDDGSNVTQSNVQNFFDTAATLGDSQSLRWDSAGPGWEVFTPGSSGAVVSVASGDGLVDDGVATAPNLRVNTGNGLEINADAVEVNLGTGLQFNSGAIELDDSTVNYNNISNTPTLGTMSAESTASYYTQSNMQTSGQAQIHWNNLTNVPALPDGFSLDASDGSPTNALAVDDEGFVGIGITNAGAPLEIRRPGGGYLEMGNSDGNGRFLITVDDSEGINIEASNAAGEIMLRPGTGVGVGLPSNQPPVNTIGIEGNAAIGAGFAGASSAPTNGLIVEGAVGVGTGSPDVSLHIHNSVAALRIQDNDNTTAFTQIYDVSPGQTRFQKSNDGGFALMDLSPMATDGTSEAKIRLFRETNTAGAKALEIMAGDGTSTIDSRIGTGGAETYFSADSFAYVGVGTNNPDAPLHLVTPNVNVGFVIDTDSDNGDHLFKVRGGTNGGAGLTDTDVRFVVTGNSRVGINTIAPNETLDLGGGNIDMGWEVVTNTCSNTSSCTATCPAGKYVTGGGCNSGLSSSYVRVNEPVGNNQYSCIFTAVDNAPVARAICANIR